jgi:hypothetical protein
MQVHLSVRRGSSAVLLLLLAQAVYGCGHLWAWDYVPPWPSTAKVIARPNFLGDDYPILEFSRDSQSICVSSSDPLSGRFGRAAVFDLTGRQQAAIRNPSEWSPELQAQFPATSGKAGLIRSTFGFGFQSGTFEKDAKRYFIRVEPTRADVTGPPGNTGVVQFGTVKHEGYDSPMFATVFGFTPERRLLACNDSETARVRVFSLDSPFKMVFEDAPPFGPLSPGRWYTERIQFAGQGRYMIVDWEHFARGLTRKARKTFVYRTSDWRIAWSASCAEPGPARTFGVSAVIVSDDGGLLAYFVASKNQVQIGEFVPDR